MRDACMLDRCNMMLRTVSIVAPNDPQNQFVWVLIVLFA